MPSFSVSFVRSGIEFVPSISSFALDAVDQQSSNHTPIFQQKNARSSRRSGIEFVPSISSFALDAVDQQSSNQHADLSAKEC
jgi:hypothetical protein